MAAKIYEGTTGLVIDIPLLDKNGDDAELTNASFARLDVLAPGATTETSWPATIEQPNIIRHIVPEETPLVKGAYKIQPYIETNDGFKGPWGPIIMVVSKKYT